MIRNGDIVPMRAALQQARLAAEANEVPVGAVITVAGEIVAAAYNRPLALNDPSAHAEILAIRAAAKRSHAYRLSDAAIYVTLEPCVMCVGAIIQARIARVHYGAHDPKAGALGSVYDIGRDGRLNHRLEVYAGIMADECGQVLRDFFALRRNSRPDS